MKEFYGEVRIGKERLHFFLYQSVKEIKIGALIKLADDSDYKSC